MTSVKYISHCDIKTIMPYKNKGLLQFTRQIGLIYYSLQGKLHKALPKQGQFAFISVIISL